MTIKELQHLRYLLKLFLDNELNNYPDIDFMEFIYFMNRLRNIEKEMELKQ